MKKLIFILCIFFFSSVFAQVVDSTKDYKPLTGTSKRWFQLSSRSDYLLWDYRRERFSVVPNTIYRNILPIDTAEVIVSRVFGSGDTTQTMRGYYKLKGTFDFSFLNDVDTTKHGIIVLPKRLNTSKIGSLAILPVTIGDSTWNRLVIIRANGIKDIIPYFSDIAASGGAAGGWTLSGTTPAKIYSNFGKKIHVRGAAGDTTETDLFNVYGSSTFKGIPTFQNDSLRINNLYYDFPSTRFVGSIPYDSLGNGNLVWRHSPMFLDKNNTITGLNTFTNTNTFNGNLKFSSSGSFSLPIAASTTKGDAWYQEDGTYTVGEIRGYNVNGAFSLIRDNATYSNPAWVASLSENKISFTDITTNNASTTKHGYLPKLNNSATQFLNGQGNWATPATGITSLNGLTGATQTFSITDDTNVLLDIVSTGTTHAFTMGWSGQLSLARGGTNSSSFTLNEMLYYNGTSIVSSGFVRTELATDLSTSGNDVILQNYTGSTLSTITVPYATSAGSISGTLAINKGGTNATSYTLNEMLLYDGTRFVSSGFVKTELATDLSTSTNSLLLQNYAGTTLSTIGFKTINSSAIFGSTDITVTIPPAANTDNNIPLWNGVNSKTLKDGLAFTSAATASTIVGRDGSANSYFNNVYANAGFLGSVGNYGSLYIYSTHASGYYAQIYTNPFTASRILNIPDASGTFALTTIAGGGTNATSFTNNEMLLFDGTRIASAGFVKTELATDLSTSGNTILLQNYTGTTLSTITAPYATTAGTVTNGVYTNANNTYTGSNTFSEQVIYTRTSGSPSNTIDAGGSSYIQSSYYTSFNLDTFSNPATGQVLIFENSGSNNIVIRDVTIGGGNIKLAGATNYTMGQYDTLTLIYNGTYWLETARSNN